MLDSLLTRFKSAGIRNRIGVFAILGAVLWIGFFDSHSIMNRVRWHRSADQLEIANEEIRKQISDLTERVDSGLSDAMIERIAREEYGMRRPGETVYRVETER